MLLTLTRIRHNASAGPLSPTQHNHHNHHPSKHPISNGHNNHNGHTSPHGHNPPPHYPNNNNNNDKYSKINHHHKHSDSKTSCAARLQFWSWMVCGVICSFLAIEYSMRAFSLLPWQHSLPADTADSMESILTPLRSVGASLATPPKLPREEYSFDNAAFLKPDPLQHAILIPYRDRKFHLELFLEYMGPYLHHHFPNAKFTLWILEQDDTELFNRAWLANVGLREIVQQAPQTSCVIFHDVDLVPNMTSHVPYTTCQYPIQLGSELQHFNWTVPYPAYCGGITSLSLKHWQLINGLGNDYIGWGGEDDDLYHRLRQNGLLYQQPDRKDLAPVPRRPPKGQGVFRTISQKAEHHEQKKTHNQYWKTLELLKEMHENSERWKFDGMNDVYYTITASQSSVPDLGFVMYHHIKAIPQKTRDGKVVYHKNADGTMDATPLAPLEFVHVPYTGGQAITKAAAKVGIVWGACHYGKFAEWNCPEQGSGDFQYSPMEFKASYEQAQTPWHIPLLRFLENPMEGTKRFTVVRHPYSRAISFYRYTYDKQHGYPYGYKYHDFVENKEHPPLEVAQYLREREHPEKLNAFLQNFLIRSHHPYRPDGIDLIPQVNFVYHRGLKYVHHVLHYEFLQRDFKNILEKYDLNGIIELPPPDRKRKRKKPYVKKFEEKRIPKTTWTWRSMLIPLQRLVGLADSQPPPVVDMSLAEIEDEYLLGAQDLANETIAMLNAHFDLDFRKFHYAKIKVNATTDAYWNPIQIIPRESGVAKQQSDRNNALIKQKTNTQVVLPPPQEPKPGAPKATATVTIKRKEQTATETSKNEENTENRSLEDRKARLIERLKAHQQQHESENEESVVLGAKSVAKPAATMKSMRQLAEDINDKGAGQHVESDKDGGDNME